MLLNRLDPFFTNSGCKVIDYSKLRKDAAEQDQKDTAATGGQGKRSQIKEYKEGGNNDDVVVPDDIVKQTNEALGIAIKTVKQRIVDLDENPEEMEILAHTWYGDSNDELMSELRTRLEGSLEILNAWKADNSLISYQTDLQASGFVPASDSPEMTFPTSKQPLVLGRGYLNSSSRNLNSKVNTLIHESAHPLIVKNGVGVLPRGVHNGGNLIRDVSRTVWKARKGKISERKIYRAALRTNVTAFAQFAMKRVPDL